MLSFKGILNKSDKLFLLDIFSYSCMNCQRSLEFIKNLDKKYKRQLKTVLIHAPEWNFEKNRKNIVNFIQKNKIKFPVIIDKDKKIIKNLKADFWPAMILMKNNKILYKHIGEGNYKKLEKVIQNTLKIKSKKIFRKEPKYSKFPTIYLGKKKGKIPALKGKWKQKDEFIQHTGKEGSLTIQTKGKIVSFVASASNKKPVKVSIKLNNKFHKKITVNKPDLYDIAKLKNNKKNKLTVVTKSKLKIYSFSFK